MARTDCHPVPPIREDRTPEPDLPTAPGAVAPYELVPLAAARQRGDPHGLTATEARTLRRL